MFQSEIEWTNDTWNPWQGCIKVSPGCKFCYMYRDKKRYGQDPQTVVRSKPPTFKAPLNKLKGPLVFTCSWSDFFIDVADPWRTDAWDIIRRTPHLTYQILTKRPERIANHLPPDWGNGWPNVWLGVSVENNLWLDKRLPWLLRVPSQVRFLSLEPLLGPLTLFDLAGPVAQALAADNPHKPLYAVDMIDWVIVGGESGPNARPLELDWIRDIMAQCQMAGIPVFVKQLGVPWAKANGAKHRKGGDPGEWPLDLRVREMVVGN